MRIICGLALALVAFGQDVAPEIFADNVLTADEKKAGWVLLFDGKTFNGWDDPHAKTPPGDAWSIEDGALHAKSHPRIREDLLTNRTFGNFDLVFDWKISPKGNSGLKYRIQDRVELVRGKTKPGAKGFEEIVDYEYEHRRGDRSKLTATDQVEDYPIAFEYQMIDDKGHEDALRGGKQISGALYSMVAPSQPMAKPVGRWNHSRIVLKGNHVEHWLNGVKVVDTQLDAPAVAESVAERWTRQSPVYKLLTTQPKKSCPIGLQNHNDEAWFRNIKILPLR